MSNQRNALQVRGLYAVTADGFAQPGAVLRAAASALAGGARVLQYRDKHQLSEETARQLALLCRAAGARLIINDDVSLAALADGVHLGRDDMAVAEARATLGPHKIIGVSCYNDLQRALAAQQAGADYVAFGSLFPSSTKPHAPRASLALIRQAKTCLQIPVVAIGGITLQNAASVVDAGADAIAVINAVFSAPDIQQAAQAFSDLFKNPL